MSETVPAGRPARVQSADPVLTEIVRNAITQPGLVLQHLLVPAKIKFVLQLLIPLAFIPLIGFDVFAMTLPTFAYLLTT